ncbi:box A-binding factor-like [Anopheles aquasalis]|uniref:box A-binding factor-like n=1 Tax=Anopheles aquasalis TaxID=42839 RepID=UPI00215B1C41|nr:box A-binding factor-like [Anopheles aquasalis]
MDCCSSTTANNYLDYRHHSMNNNFCYPYTPSMLRSASPYPMATGAGGGGGGGGAGRYGAGIPDGYHHRSGYGAASSSTGGMGGYNDINGGGYDKYYGAGYHHPHHHHHPHHSAAPTMGHGAIGGGYGSSGYYGSYSSSYREYGGYNPYYHHHHHHQSQSPYSRAGLAGMPPGYGSGGAGYLYPGRHMAGSSSNPSAYPPYHLQREHHQYSSFASYANGSNGMTASSYRSNLGSLQTEQSSNGSSSKVQHHHQQQQQQHGYSSSQGFGHNDRAGLAASNTNQTDGAVSNASAGSPSTAATSLFPSSTSVSNGFSTGSSSEYSPLSASYGPADSPQLPLQPPQQSQHHHQQQQGQNDSTAENGGESPTPTSATADYHHPLTDGVGKDSSSRGGGGGSSATTRKPKERKHQRAYGNGQTGNNGTGNGGSESSRTSSPTASVGGAAAAAAAATASSSSSNGGASAPAAVGAVAPASARMKSLDALTNLCWPDGEQFTSKMRKYSNAGGTKSKDTANNRKQDANEVESGVSSSPSRAHNGTGRRTKKLTKQQKEQLKSSDAKDKQTNAGAAVTATPPVENKNITPLPGFQQAFGSTEIGKFSEAFFNSSPTPNDTSTPEHHHHHHHPLHHHQLSEQQPPPSQQHQQQLQLLHHSQRTSTPQQQAHHQLSGGTVEQLLMDSLHSYESDVDTMSPQQQPWDHAVTPGTTMGSLDRLSSYESCHNGGNLSSAAAGYNLQIGTSFHPSYYESSSYSSDHAVDSPLGSYFSEMTCNEFVN